MSTDETIYVLGSGAIGFPLAAFLSNKNNSVMAVRTSRSDIPKSTVSIAIRSNSDRIQIPVDTISLSRLNHLQGIIVVTAKSYANPAIARQLRAKAATGPLVILQNGLGVEKPFLDAGFPAIYRCILYATGQLTSEHEYVFRPITSSPIGVIKGSKAELAKCVEALTTGGFPFHSEVNIQQEIWKKAIINSVFNSICPLLDVDNGVFIRNEETANLARELIRECISLTDRLEVKLDESELMEQILLISKTSDGQLISTLQDIKAGRPTEIESLNLEIARIAASLEPRLSLSKTELLGKLIQIKSLQSRR